MGLKEEGFYHSPEWRRLRKMALQRDHYLCQHCLRAGRIKRATEVHHLIEVERDPSQALVLDNLLSLCWDCHERTKHKRGKQLPTGARIVRVVDGERDEDIPPPIKSRPKNSK